ncbi:MAG: hypothetical protein ACLQPD_20580 [Desulfomonilaceae bacterium]
MAQAELRRKSPENIGGLLYGRVDDGYIVTPYLNATGNFHARGDAFFIGICFLVATPAVQAWNGANPLRK